MAFKLLNAAILFVAFVEAQQYPYPAPWEDDDDPFKRIDYEAPTEKSCNESAFCYPPCGDIIPPPPKCPKTMPECRSGCACFNDCSTGSLVCFMTKHCTVIRRILTKHRRPRVISQDVGVFSFTEPQAIGHHPDYEIRSYKFLAFVLD